MVDHERVATAAGVSIGSLYQYFPNKEALVAALIEQHVEQMNAAVLAELARVATLPIAQAARCVIELTIRAHAIDPDLHQVLTEQVPRVGKLAKLRELDEICHRMVAGLLAARKQELAINDPDIAAFLLCSTIESIVHRAALLYPHRLRDPRLIDEATLLVTRYLVSLPIKVSSAMQRLASGHDRARPRSVPAEIRTQDRSATAKQESAVRPLANVFVASYVTQDSAVGRSGWVLPLQAMKVDAGATVPEYTSLDPTAASVSVFRRRPANRCARHVERSPVSRAGRKVLRGES